MEAPDNKKNAFIFLVWYYLPDLHPHRSTMILSMCTCTVPRLDRQDFHWQKLFLERDRDSQDQQAHCYTSYPHISHRPEKKGTPTLCCNFTQPPSAFIWSVTSEIIHQPQLLSDPLILFLSLTLFLCRHKELKGERLSFLVMLLWEGGYCCDCRENRKKCSWILHLCIHFFKNECKQVIKKARSTAG